MSNSDTFFFFNGPNGENSDSEEREKHLAIVDTPEAKIPLFNPPCIRFGIQFDLFSRVSCKGK